MGSGAPAEGPNRRLSPNVQIHTVKNRQEASETLELIYGVRASYPEAQPEPRVCVLCPSECIKAR